MVHVIKMSSSLLNTQTEAVKFLIINSKIAQSRLRELRAWYSIAVAVVTILHSLRHLYSLPYRLLICRKQRPVSRSLSTSLISVDLPLSVLWR